MGCSVFFLSGPGSSYSLWTGQTPPPFSQSCATMFFVTGDNILYSELDFQIQKDSIVSNSSFAKVCHAQPIWLLPTVGSKLGVQVEWKRHPLRNFLSKSPNIQEERHFGRGASLCSGHHCHAGGWYSSSKHYFYLCQFQVETDQFYKFFLPELKRDG